MLDDPLANLEGKVQSGKLQIALLELLHDSQRMQVVVEAISVFAHQFVQARFAGMPKWRMSDVMHEAERFRQICVQTKCFCHSARDLGDFDGMCEPIAEMIGVAGGEDLGLCFQAAKR